uniref:Uncharacterized protein n=1 Tax=Romanomermis culicivorax TaxID=13658 RepID=A0A915K445_ROMCU
SLTAYKVCCNDTNTLFEEKSFGFGSNIRALEMPKIFGASRRLNEYNISFSYIRPEGEQFLFK